MKTTEAVREALPPLPRAKMLVGPNLDSLHVLYTADQMRGYALAAVAAPSLALPEEWRAMLYAPTDGTEVELLLHHANWRFAGDNRAQWEQVVRSKWIDHNGGGWTWRGMCGNPMGWRPIAAPDQARGEG